MAYLQNVKKIFFSPFRKCLSLLITSNHFCVSVFSTHITHRGTGRRFHLSSLRHINHSRGGLRASCALVSRGSRDISLQVKCNQSVYRRTCAHVGRTQTRTCTAICKLAPVVTGTDYKQPVGTMRDW